MSLTSFVFGNTGWFEADLFTITLPTGTVIRATSHQRDLVYGGNTYYAMKYGKWERDKIEFKTNELGETTVMLTADNTVLFPGTARPMLWVSKMFVRSAIQIAVAILATTDPLTIIGVTELFSGRISAPSLEAGRASFKCSDDTYLLLLPWPQRVIQPGCPFTLFDRGCTLNRASFAVTRTALAGSTPTLLVVSALGSVGNDSLPYSRGYIVPTSGEAAGWPIGVPKQIDSTHLELSPFDLQVQVGDTFTLYPGCDGQLATCDFKFSNKQNFGGFPNVPGPPAAISAVGS